MNEADRRVFRTAAPVPNMTRLLYITDTHWGATAGRGWWQQPRDPARFEPLIHGLRDWLQKNPVDLILHGGDATENGTRPQVQAAAATLASLGPPAYLCLGNHDLEQPDSIALWRELAPAALPEGRETFVVRRDEFDLYVLAHHWNQTHPPHHWTKTGQRPLLDERQATDLESHLSRADRPVLLAVHAPAAAVPPEQTGLLEPIHPPDPEWRSQLLGLSARHAALRLILCAHNHVHTADIGPHHAILSTASLSETPFEARLLTVDENTIDVQTLCFGELLGLDGEYLPEKRWTQGGPAQRSLRVACR